MLGISPVSAYALSSLGYLSSSIPTLSNPTYVPVSSTAIRPRVTVTFS